MRGRGRNFGRKRGGREWLKPMETQNKCRKKDKRKMQRQWKELDKEEREEFDKLRCKMSLEEM